MMIDAFPNASVIGLLVNPSNPNVETLSRDAQAAAQTLGLEVHVLNANTERDEEPESIHTSSVSFDLVIGSPTQMAVFTR